MEAVVEDGTIVSNAQLDCRLLEGEIVVAHIKREHVLQAAWVVLKVALYADDEAEAARRQLQRLNDPTAHAIEEGPAIAPMRGLILDGDGATLIMGRRHWGLIRESGLDHLVEVAPHAWRAFEFNLGHMVAEVPGVVNHLAKLMADDNISVLHHSTYGSEIFLVQQRELSRAIACIRKKVDATLSFLLEQRSASVPASTDSEGTPPPAESPLKQATSTTTSSSTASPATTTTAASAAAAAPAAPTDPKSLREKLRIRQWRPEREAAAVAEPALHHGHSHQGYEVEPGSPSQHQHQHQHGGRRTTTPSHHVHMHQHPWAVAEEEEAGQLEPPQHQQPAAPPLSSSPFSLHSAHTAGGAGGRPCQLVLRVMPKRLVLARIHKDALMECSGLITRLFLFDAHAAQFSTHKGTAPPATRATSGGRRYYQRERSGSIGEDYSPAASAHASSVPRLIPRAAATGTAGAGTGVPTNTPSSTLSGGAHHLGGASPSPSIGVSPELLGLSPALASLRGAPTPSAAQHHQGYRGEADFGPLALLEMEGQEVTLLLPEEDLPLFPMGALVACPLRWTPIKLCGRRFDFHETGVVSAMSKVDAGVPILNVSTFLTNVTLVEGRNLAPTLDTLSEELDASIDGLHTLGDIEEEEEEEREGDVVEQQELVQRMAGLGSGMGVVRG